MKKLVLAVIATMLFTQMTFATSPAAGQFTDVTSLNNYFNAIEFLADEGILNGNPDGSFEPSSALNRAEMLKILIESEEYAKEEIADFEESACFEDVETGKWYTKYVCYAKEKGWVVGYEDGKYFKPNQNVSFVEALKMTLKAFRYDFRTDGDVWYKEPVDIASADKLIPFTIKSFSADLRRDEMADMVTRILKYNKLELDEYLGFRQYIVPDFSSIEAGVDYSDPAVYQEIVARSEYCTLEGGYLASYEGLGLDLEVCCEGLVAVMDEYSYDNLYAGVCVQQDDVEREASDYTEEYTYYLVDLEDSGENGMFIGCMDSLIAQTVELKTKEAADDYDRVETILDYFLALGSVDEEETGLYNSIPSTLEFESMEVDGSTVYIYLTGDINIGGVCESPRMQGQLEQMVINIFPFHSVMFYVDGVSLDSMLYESYED